MPRSFYSKDFYGTPQQEYQLLPFRFISLDNERKLLVDEAGEYLLAPRGTVRQLVTRRIDSASEFYATLKARQLVSDANSGALLDILAAKYRTKKSFLNGFTKLHILVITLRCDHSSHYCQVSRQTADRTRYDMSGETAERALHLIMRSPSPHVTWEFQGGEPLLAFDQIQIVVRRAKELAAAHGKDLDIVIVTNLAHATDEVLTFCREVRRAARLAANATAKCPTSKSFQGSAGPTGWRGRAPEVAEQNDRRGLRDGEPARLWLLGLAAGRREMKKPGQWKNGPAQIANRSFTP